MLFDKKIKEQVEKITGTYYNNEDEITNCETMTEDLLYEIYYRDEEIEKLKNRISDLLEEVRV